MTEYKPPPVAGYKPLTQEQVDLMNAIKDEECAVGVILRELADDPDASPAQGRWLALARTHLEIGFMFACKAVANPSGGLGERP